MARPGPRASAAALCLASCALLGGAGAGGPPPAGDAAVLRQVADAAGVYEHVALQGPEMHNSTLAFVLSNLKDPALRERAHELDRKWQAGELAEPCVWSRRMAFATLAGGGLAAYSPVELTPALEALVRRLGELRTIVLPNREHAVHFMGWGRAFPHVALVAPSAVAEQLAVPAGWDGELVPLAPDAPLPAAAARWLGGLDVEVTGQRGFPEVMLHHLASGTLLVADFLYFGARLADPAGWPQLASCTDLYYEAWCRPAPAGVLLPTYRLGLGPEDRRSMATSMRRALAWRPRRLLSAHAGIVSDGGPDEAAALLRAAWGWCEADALGDLAHVAALAAEAPKDATAAAGKAPVALHV